MRRLVLAVLCVALAGAPLASAFAAAQPCASLGAMPCDCGTPDPTGCGTACAAAFGAFFAPAYDGVRFADADADAGSSASSRFASIAGPPGLQPPR